MKKIFWLLILIVGYQTHAQHVVYFITGNKITAEIQSYGDGKFKMQVKRGENAIARTSHRENIALIVKGSHYLVVSTLGTMSEEEANKQVIDFLNTPPKIVKRDVIIKTMPTIAIPCSITVNNDEIINYVDEDKNSASINKAEVLAVFLKDGSHEIIKEVAEAAPLLNIVKQQVNELIEKESPKPIDPPKPNPKPEPTPEPTPVPPPTPVMPDPKPNPVNKPKLTEDELQVYREKAKQKVDYFYGYLNILVDKGRSKADKDNAVEEAARLFMPNSLVQVDSDKSPGKIKSYPVREYLKRLQLLPYSTAKIDWSEVQYIKDLTQEKDGNYYGIIRGQQTFMGFGNEKNVIYSDVREKNVKVKLQSYQKQIDGQTQYNWDVLLGSIGLSVK